MHAIPWYTALLISFPQTILIIEFGFRLFNLRPKINQIIILSVLIALVCFFMRKLPISYAANTLILIAILNLCAWIVCRIDIRYCLISVILGVLIYLSLETMLLPLIMQVLKISIDELIISPWLNLVAFLPILFISLLLLWYITKKEIVLYDFGTKEIDP